MNITFTNISKGIMSTETASERAFRKHIEDEYSVDAIEIAEIFRQRLVTGLERVQPGYYGTYVEALLREAPRLCFIKHIRANGESDDNYDVEIDLLAHTYREIEV